jgi:hypothetical protein
MRGLFNLDWERFDDFVPSKVNLIIFYVTAILKRRVDDTFLD